MLTNQNPAVQFGALLQENTDAAQFYARCTPAQRQAILRQLYNVPSVEAFVQNLPSAAL